jgi:hypothetical protein
MFCFVRDRWEQRARFLSEADLQTLRGLLWLMRMGTATGSQDVVLGGDAASRHVQRRAA